MGSKREAVVSIRPAVLVFRAVAEMLPAAVATSIFVARFFFFSLSVVLLLSLCSFFCFPFYILLNVLHGWMQKNATAYSLQFCFLSFLSVVFFLFLFGVDSVGNLKKRQQKQMAKWSGIAAISKMCLDWYCVGTSVESFSAPQRRDGKIYTDNGCSCRR